jgi:hypothetical protein
MHTHIRTRTSCLDCWQRERLTNLERHALQRRRWRRDDPHEDRNSYTFEETPLYDKIPDDMVFGHITDNLRWAIFQAHRDVSAAPPLVWRAAVCLRVSIAWVVAAAVSRRCHMHT